MNRPENQSSGGINPRDILMILFRNKWKIILFALLGVAAAAGVYVTQVPPYKSTAKVLVRYIMDAPVAGVGPDGYEVRSADPRGENVINSEIEILTSWDLAKEVAEAVGAENVLGPDFDGTNTIIVAASQIRNNIDVDSERRSNVLGINYSNPNPEMAVKVLTEIVNRYLKNHLEVHRSAGSSDFLIRETEVKKNQMERYLQDLNELKAKLKISTTVDETKLQLNHEIAEMKSLILNVRADLAQYEAQLSDAARESLARTNSGEAVAIVPSVDEPTVSKYRGLNERLDYFRREELNLIGQFTPENPRVKSVLQNIGELEAQKKAMEQEHPGLLVVAAPVQPGAGGRQVPDSSGMAAQVVASQARLKLLEKELAQSEADLAAIVASETRVRELERQFGLEEKNYLHFSSNLERVRFDEALDPSKIPNINIVQKPSFPLRDNAKRLKMAGGAFAIFFALGLGLAFARELVFDQTIRNPLEVESRLQLPLFMSIPRLSDRNPVKLITNGASKKSDTDSAVARVGHAPWEMSHFIRPYCEALRDRLIMYFQLKNLHHKPKLVALTSCNEGAGTTTLAAGLAASLSETGDGKVLLVDMNVNRPEMHPFFRGNLASSLADLLQPGLKGGHGEKENLYLASASDKNGHASQLVPAKFYEMLPKLKSSDFDYIIFDMPPIKQTSATVALSGFMDKVLLVMEPGKTHRDSIKRATDMMRQQRADVAGIVNRMPESAMKWLQPDLH